MTNNHTPDPRFKFAYLISSKKTETMLLLVIAGFLLSTGFLIGSTSPTNGNYQTIFLFAHPYVWSAIFFIYSSIKLTGIFCRVDYSIKVLNSVIGLWAWNYIFLSFVAFDSSPIAPTEVLLALPIIAEAWLLLSYIHNQHIKRDRYDRRN